MAAWGPAQSMGRPELGDRQTVGEQSAETLPPRVSEIEVFGACHERAPRWDKGTNPPEYRPWQDWDLACAYSAASADPAGSGSPTSRPAREPSWPASRDDSISPQSPGGQTRFLVFPSKQTRN